MSKAATNPALRELCVVETVNTIKTRSMSDTNGKYRGLVGAPNRRNYLFWVIRKASLKRW